VSEAVQKTVLAIDSETLARDKLSSALQPDGYKVILTRGVAQAFDYLDKNPPPDLILLQVPPADMDTVTFLWRLRGIIPDPFPPVVAVTRATVIGAAWVKAYGFAGLIRKPIDVQDVAAVVGACLRTDKPASPPAGVDLC
jgi:CheY-like chemotaxis protein